MDSRLEMSGLQQELSSNQVEGENRRAGGASGKPGDRGSSGTEKPKEISAH